MTKKLREHPLYHITFAVISMSSVCYAIFFLHEDITTLFFGLLMLIASLIFAAISIGLTKHLVKKWVEIDGVGRFSIITFVLPIAWGAGFWFLEALHIFMYVLKNQ